MTLAVTGASLDGELVGLRCEDGAIAALGPGVGPQPGDEAIDARGGALLAPLLNGHTHAAMTLFRGSGGDLPLMPWLEERIWPIEAKLEADDVYWGTRLACAEMTRTGTTRFWDMYWQPQATARAVADAGLRAAIGAPLFDHDGDGERMRRSALASLDQLSELGPGISPALAPHSIYMVGEESLRWIAELGAEREVPVHIHLSETENEVQDCLARHGLRPAFYLDRLGMLNERAVLAHGVWLDPDELALIAERGATVVTNPVANMKLAVGGVFPYPAARSAGVAVGLGTDGAGSNDSLDLMADLKAFALAQKHAAGDPTAVRAAEAWEIATGRRAPLLGAGAGLEVGAAADFLLMRPDLPELAIGDLGSNLVYAASGSAVETTVVGGRALMRDGEVPEIDEIVARAAERARRLGLQLE
ncbi:MAG: 5-methylthioadenosine/S-adenosylhomocysteine deaminase [Solirubrobacterales bacterium]|nr:5-methylthioadenosine/S-adenosylhomocysteine deaminase [Solirubrobacterales bacterium]